MFLSDLIFDVSTPTSKADQHCWYADMALRVVVHPRDGETPLTITLVAQTAHEKAAWLSDLKQVSITITIYIPNWTCMVGYIIMAQFIHT
jgi:hypothetical protein